MALALAAGAPVEARIHALLVGVSHYPNLTAEWQIQGPANDVDLLAEVLLTGGFGIQPEDVVRLAGWPEDPTARPTRANVERELAQLAEKVRPGDQVIVFLAGHGSRQPAAGGGDDLESDGLDEIFLPADVGHWNGDAGHLPGAIVDDEIRAWVTAIRNRGAFVWCLIDACHSGTMTRGGGERERQVPPEALGIPIPEASGAELGSRETSHLDLADDAGGLVAMYASQAYETAPEKILPWPEGRYQGLFTYTVASVLKQRRSPLTYRELAAEVAARYRSMGRDQPTPLVEGGGLDREVLGLSVWPGRPRFRLGGELPARAGHYPLAAGHLAGLSRGTILSVFPPAGTETPDRQIGYASIVDIDAVRSVVTPVRAVDDRWQPIPSRAQEAAWPAGSRCAVHSLSFDFTLRVALQRGEGEAFAAGTGPEAAEAALAAAIGRHPSFLRRVDRAVEADWFVRLLADDIVLVPASGWSLPDSGRDPVPRAFRAGKMSRSLGLADRLAAMFWSIARARHLLALETTAGVTDEPLEIGLGVRVFQDSNDRIGKPLEWGPRGLGLVAGQEVAFEVLNRSPHPVDVTLLFVDGAYGIHPMFPREGASNRLGPGERLFPIYRTRVNAATLGKESVVAIAVKAAGPQVSFVELAQPTLEAYRNKQRGSGASISPLERLLESALHGTRNHRGPGAAEAADYVVEVLSWETRPSEIQPQVKSEVNPQSNGGNPS